ncbi:putative inactive nicotinamidase At3g16190 [Bidens hawaiensis]|uniref:putative inactive nicotinamidase At3g16190 n=1 Tax=Bidens hawaiensis TaxID=980011 RepID=UPI00404A5CE4
MPLAACSGVWDGVRLDLRRCVHRMSLTTNTYYSQPSLSAFQNDFLLEDSPIRLDGGLAIVPNVIKAIEDARRRGFVVVWVVQQHDPLGRDVELFRRPFYADGKLKPTSKGSKGAELVDGLVIKPEDYKVVNTRFSAFFYTNLHSFLQGAGIDSLVVVGIQTPNCIWQTVFDAVSLDYKPVTVIVDATAAATPDVHSGMLIFFALLLVCE